MKNKKNKYKEKDAEKRRKERDKTRREVSNKKMDAVVGMIK